MLQRMGIGVALSSPLDEFRADMEASGRSANTVSAYMRDIGIFSRFFEAQNGQAFTLEYLTGVDLAAWRAHSLDVERVAPATWNRRRASLASLAGWAREHGYITYDPMANVDPKKDVDSGPRWLSRAALNKVLRILEVDINGATTPAWRIQALRDNAIVQLMALAGLREGEVVALDPSDIILMERSGSVQIRSGKGDKSRVVPLNKAAREALRAWLEVRDEGYKALFYGKGSGRISTRSIQRMVADLARRAGVRFTAHQLRHTFAKRILDSGAPLTVLQRLLGHAKLETTARYVKPGWDDLERAVGGI